VFLLFLYVVYYKVVTKSSKSANLAYSNPLLKTFQKMNTGGMKKIALFLCAFVGLAVASQLEIYEDRQILLLQRTSDPKEIAVQLRAIGVRFEQWEAIWPLTPSSGEEEIQEAYRADIERLKEENGFQSVDVLRMSPDRLQPQALRQKFLNEHTHDEPEVRFFVEGSGLFFLHVDGKVYSVLCEQGDLISIPENYCHWFDMGENPYFTAIRFFTRTDGWIAYFTGDPISYKFAH